MMYSIFEVREFVLQHLLYLDAQVAAKCISYDNYCQLRSFLLGIYGKPSLVRNYMDRGEYMAIEGFISSRDPDLGQLLQNGRSRNSADVIMIISLNKSLLRAAIGRSLDLLNTLHTLTISSSYKTIEAFTQGEYSGLMLSSTLFYGFYEHIRKVHERLTTSLLTPYPNIFAAGPGHGSALASRYINNLPRAYPTSSSPFIPQQILGDASYLTALYDDFSLFSLHLMQVSNTLRTYVTKSNIISCRMTWGKSSAIPGKRNLYQFERLHVFANCIHSLRSALNNEALLCGLYNEFRLKNLYRYSVNSLFIAFCNMLSLFNKLISSVETNANGVPSSSACMFDYAESLSLESSTPFRTVYNLLEESPLTEACTYLSCSDTSPFLSRNFYARCIHEINVTHVNLVNETKASIASHDQFLGNRHNCLLK